MAAPIIPFDVEQQKLAAAPLIKDLATLQLAAKSVVITDDDSYANAMDVRNKAGSAEKKINEFWEPMCKAAHELHKSLTGARGAMLKPYTDVRDALDKLIKKYILDQQTAKRLVEERLRKEADSLKSNLQEKAEDLIAAGRVQEARSLMAQSQVIDSIPSSLPSSVPKADNSRVTAKKVGECYDLLALIKAVAKGDVPLTHYVKGEEKPLITVDQRVLNAVVDRMGDSLKWPGVRVKDDVVIGAIKL